MGSSEWALLVLSPWTPISPLLTHIFDIFYCQLIFPPLKSYCFAPKPVPAHWLGQVLDSGLT